MTEFPRFPVIVPTLEDHAEDIADDFRQLSNTTVADAAALNASLQPCGNPPEDRAAGYVRFFRQLREAAGLDWVRCSHECPYGTIRSEWRIEGGAFEWTVEVPPNTTATLVPPPAASGAIPIGGEGAIPATFGRRPAWRVGSGKFEIRTPFSRNL